MKAKRVLRRKEHLFSEIEKGKTQNQHIELIIGTQAGAQQLVAKKLAALGEITRVYELIPFIAVKFEPEVAEQLARYIHNNNVSNGFKTAHSSFLEKIISVDVSSDCSIVPSPTAGEPDIYLELKVESLWNLRNIGAYDAHQLSTGNGTKIGIIDTGADYNHSQLRHLFGAKKGYNFVDNDSDPMDGDGHGTHVSGTACSKDYGVSLESRLYSIRVLDDEGYGFESDVIAGVEWCINNDIDVANMSLGSRDASKAFEQICQVAYNKRLLLVAAAGNERYGPSYPAAFDESVIAVAATNRLNKHAGFSNIYETNDISAPGVGIMSCFPGDKYRMWDGTSMATPHVTGTIALALSMFKKNPKLLEDYIDQTAEQLENNSNYDDQWVFGSGLVRADHLLQKIVNDKRFARAIKSF